MSGKFVSRTDDKDIGKPMSAIVKAGEGASDCSLHGKGWIIKGYLGMVVCCIVPLLLIGVVVAFGLSLGTIASGVLSLIALLACPVGMFLMMRMMTNKQR